MMILLILFFSSLYDILNEIYALYYIKIISIFNDYEQNEEVKLDTQKVTEYNNKLDIWTKQLNKLSTDAKYEWIKNNKKPSTTKSTKQFNSIKTKMEKQILPIIHKLFTNIDDIYHNINIVRLVSLITNNKNNEYFMTKIKLMVPKIEHYAIKEYILSEQKKYEKNNAYKLCYEILKFAE